MWPGEANLLQFVRELENPRKTEARKYQFISDYKRKKEQKEIGISLLKRINGEANSKILFEFKLNTNGFIDGGSPWTDTSTYRNGKFEAKQNDNGETGIEITKSGCGIFTYLLKVSCFLKRILMDFIKKGIVSKKYELEIDSMSSVRIYSGKRDVLKYWLDKNPVFFKREWWRWVYMPRKGSSLPINLWQAIQCNRSRTPTDEPAPGKCTRW